MTKPLWLAQPDMQALLHRIVDRLDKADSNTMRAFKLDRKSFPALFEAVFEADKENVWSQLKDFEKWGWLRIKTDRPKPGMADYDLNPRLEIIDALAIRQEVGRLQPVQTPQQLWREAVFCRLSLSEDQMTVIASQKLDIPGKSAEQIVERLALIFELADEPLLLREVSARLFWGHSKVLDHRQELVAALLGVTECPFPELPIQLQVFLPFSGFDGVLFIENLTNFERATRNQTGQFAGLVLIFASGFMGAARRLRSPSGVSVYFAGHGHLAADATARFHRWLVTGGEGLAVWFWGDLDFAGMAILKALRQSFPDLQAWQPGYQPMLDSLLAGGGHAPEAANKAKQKPVTQTGCGYADTRLIPALLQTGLFLDQEFF